MPSRSSRRAPARRAAKKAAIKASRAIAPVKSEDAPSVKEEEKKAEEKAGTPSGKSYREMAVDLMRGEGMENEAKLLEEGKKEGLWAFDRFFDEEDLFVPVSIGLWRELGHEMTDEQCIACLRDAKEDVKANPLLSEMENMIDGAISYFEAKPEQEVSTSFIHFMPLIEACLPDKKKGDFRHCSLRVLSTLKDPEKAMKMGDQELLSGNFQKLQSMLEVAGEGGLPEFEEIVAPPRKGPEKETISQTPRHVGERKKRSGKKSASTHSPSKGLKVPLIPSEKTSPEGVEKPRSMMEATGEDELPQQKEIEVREGKKVKRAKGGRGKARERREVEPLPFDVSDEDQRMKMREGFYVNLSRGDSQTFSSSIAGFKKWKKERDGKEVSPPRVATDGSSVSETVDAEWIRTSTSGDTITARSLHESSEELPPSYGLKMFASKYPPTD